MIKILDVKGAIITIDASGLTVKILSEIKRKEADFVVAVKNPNKALLNKIQSELDSETSCKDVFEEQETKTHGRIEKRVCEVVNLSSEFNKVLSKNRARESKPIYPDFNSAIRITAHRTLKGKESIQKRYYVSSLVNPTARN